jgi:hypothetical protein
MCLTVAYLRTPGSLQVANARVIDGVHRPLASDPYCLSDHDLRACYFFHVS